MRILSVGNRYPPWSTGGYETTWAGAAHALREAGHPTRVLTTRADPSDRAVAGALPTDVHRELRWYWREHAFPRLRGAECLRIERWNAAVLRGQVRSFAPDVVMWWAMGAMSLSLLEQARRLGTPALAVVADDWILYGPEVDAWTRRWRGVLGGLGAPAADRFTGIPARLTLDRAARWSFISEYVLAAARSAGWRLDGASVEHPGVDPDRFPRRDPRPWGWRLLYCGRIDPRKGIDTAVRALAQLPAQATLTIDGDGEPAELAALRSLAAELGLEDRVAFRCSPAPDVPHAYAQADAVLFPVTWREPWGLVPLEAMAVGAPVLASRAGGGPAEYLEPERNCLQFEPGSAAGLARGLDRLAAGAELRAQLVSGGHATAARFTAGAYHRRLLERLHESVARGPEP
jgi:glycogen(starch) synthase